MPANRETITVLVLEHGAAWPSWGGELRRRAPNTTVESQLPAETLPEFRSRVERRLRRLSAEGIDVSAAAYVCASAQESADAMTEHARQSLTQLAAPVLCAESRRAIAETIVTHLRPAQGADGDSSAEFILAGGAWAYEGSEGEARSQLIQLCGSLSMQAPGRTVSVRFDEPPHESGTYRVDRRSSAAPDSRRLRERRSPSPPSSIPSAPRSSRPPSVMMQNRDSSLPEEDERSSFLGLG